MNEVRDRIRLQWSYPNSSSIDQNKDICEYGCFCLHVHNAKLQNICDLFQKYETVLGTDLFNHFLFSESCFSFSPFFNILVEIRNL